MKDNTAEIIAKFFLNSLYMRPLAQLAYPLPVEYIDKMLIKIDKLFQ